MKINKERFLADLHMVKAGLSPREFIEQSSCFVFQDRQVMTFNDEVACRKNIDADINGAVSAAPLIGILEKIADDTLTIEETENGELRFHGKRKWFKVVRDKEIFLPIDRVEKAKQWQSLPKDFDDIVNRVVSCVSRDETKFVLTCVHFHPEWIEACDNLQVLHWKIQLGIQESVLVRGKALTHILGLNMHEVAVTKSWIHFRNPSGLIFSCRKYREEFYDLTKAMLVEGHKIEIPKGLVEASDRANVFASDTPAGGDPLVRVSLMEGKIKILGEGLSGEYGEIKKINYTGPKMSFMISPVLLKYISENYRDAVLSSRKLKAIGGSKEKGGKWEYVTSLGRPEKSKKEAKKEEETE